MTQTEDQQPDLFAEESQTPEPIIDFDLLTGRTEKGLVGVDVSMENK